MLLSARPPTCKPVAQPSEREEEEEVCLRWPTDEIEKEACYV